jgi:hypothetical protein
VAAGWAANWFTDWPIKNTCASGKPVSTRWSSACAASSWLAYVAIATRWRAKIGLNTAVSVNLDFFCSHNYNFIDLLLHKIDKKSSVSKF